MPSGTQDKPTSETNSPHGCLKAVYFLGAIFIIAFVVVVVLVVPPIMRLRCRVATVPFPSLTQEDLWSLQDKINALSTVSGKAQTLVLTHSEFNSLLGRFEPMPTMGFAVVRTRFVSSPKPMLIFRGSGFWMKNVTVSLEIIVGSDSDNHAVDFGTIRINDLQCDNFMLAKIARAFLNEYIEKTTGLRCEKGLDNRYKLIIASESVTIEGDLLAFRLPE